MATIALSAIVHIEYAELKMRENVNRKQELESATKEYLNQAEIHPMSDSWEKAQTGDYVMVFGLSPFSRQDDPEFYGIVAPKEAERKLIEKVDSLFDSQIRAATVRTSLQSAITLTGKNTQFVYPFESDELEQQYHDKIYELLKSHYESRYDTMVPIYQLECADGVEFPLANAVMYSGGRRSRLAKIANYDENHLIDSDRQQIELCSYLKFPVTGDSVSCLEQVEHETERALQVLIFIYPWFENNRKAFNPAHGVSMWKHSGRVIVYDRTSATNFSSLWHAEIPNGIFGARKLSAEILVYAQKVRGLDDINYHIKNSEFNPVSQRICRALSFYDAAAQSPIAQFAFGNFVISIDILLPANSVRGPILTNYLGSLIEHGKFYTGEMILDAELTNPEQTEWPERVRLATADFKDFYTTRGQILHGSSEERYKTRVSSQQVKKARQIAHNAIRAYAYLALAFNWQSDKEAKNWFKAPFKPPSEDDESDS